MCASPTRRTRRASVRASSDHSTWPFTTSEPESGWRMPHSHLQQLRLAVACHAGDAQDLAAPDAQAHVLEAAHAGIVDRLQVARLQQHLARLRGALVDAQQHPAAHHQLRQVLARGVRGADVGHHRAAPHHRHLVGDRHDLAQLVGDQDDGAALFLERGQDAEQVGRFLRREHAGRLVQDQGFRAAVQRLEDLDALLDAYRQAAHRRVHIHLQPVVALQALQVAARPAQAVAQQCAVLGAEQDVLQHRERLHQHEVLVHHADAGGDGVAGTGDRRRPAVDLHAAGVGPVEAVQDAHQGRLAGTVLADDAVYRPLRDRYRDVPVRLYRAEPLVDAAQRYGRRNSGRPVLRFPRQ